jgi:hypothetical protein
MNTFFISMVLALLFPVSLIGQQIGTVTLKEGDMRLIRGTTVMQGVEGMRLNRGDILELGNPGLAQLEFVSGTVVGLGPDSRLFLLSYPNGASTPSNAAELVLLSGWLKGEGSPKSAFYRFDTPSLGAITKDGTVVLHASGESSEIFVESGTATIAQLTSAGNTSESSAGKAGQFFVRLREKKVVRADQPSGNFVNSLPIPFRDTLPSRLSRFTGKPAEPKRQHEVSYSDIRAWLVMAPRWRKNLVSRFQPRLKDDAFRQEIEAHLDDHPEWDAALNPEKDSSKQHQP